jgi:hypothetical protein
VISQTFRHPVRFPEHRASVLQKDAEARLLLPGLPGFFLAVPLALQAALGLRVYLYTRKGVVRANPFTRTSSPDVKLGALFAAEISPFAANCYGLRDSPPREVQLRRWT